MGTIRVSPSTEKYCAECAQRISYGYYLQYEIFDLEGDSDDLCNKCQDKGPHTIDHEDEEIYCPHCWPYVPKNQAVLYPLQGKRKTRKGSGKKKSKKSTAD